MSERISEFDVFISYKREDAAFASELEQFLTSHGFDVFRDTTRLEIADHIDIALPAALQKAAAVVVLWSDRAVKSPWVNKEANYAAVAGKYLPVLLPGFDAGKLPADFRDIHALRFDAVSPDCKPLCVKIQELRRRQLPAALQVEIENRMPASGEHLIGRDEELSILDDAWASGKTRLVVLDAMGGTGKTALINRFLANMGDDPERPWRGAQRVYCWSFYSQGTDEKRQGDADSFFAQALEWFGYEGTPITSANRRGRTLAELINKRRTLLVLDGLEPLQYPAHSPGLEGKLKDDGLAALFKQLSVKMNGMAVVTTRIPIPELKDRHEPAVRKVSLNQLKTDHGVALLKRIGVRAGDKEMRDAVDHLRGHALSLNLLGSYSVNVLDHQLPTRAEIEALLVSPEVSEAAHVMMRRYEILLEDRASEVARPDQQSTAGRQLALLYMIGLFDRPAEPDAMDVLLAEPIPGLTDNLANFHTDPGKWRFAIAALRKMGLLLPETQVGELDAHPLVREYFGKRLKESRPQAFKAANLRLYEHYKLKDLPPEYRAPIPYALLSLAGQRGTTHFREIMTALLREEFPAELYHVLPEALRGVKPDAIQSAIADLDDDGFREAMTQSRPDTLKGLEPLLSAVAHGTAAGVYDGALNEIYRARMSRGTEGYLVHKLGAYGAELSTLAHFFDVPFAAPSAGVGASDQTVLLGDASFALRALGRLKEAEAPISEALRRSVAAEDWSNAAIAANNLSEVRLSLGLVNGASGSALTNARDSVAHADRSADDFLRVAQRSTHANVLHQAGDLKGAAALFAVAEKMQGEHQKQFDLLYSLRGYQYCDLMLSTGAPAEVRRRAGTTLEWVRPQNWLLDIALDTLSLGRAALSEGRLDEAAAQIEEAVEGLRAAGTIHHITFGLLIRAALHRATGAFDLTTTDLDEIDEIAGRSHLRLSETDALLERARLALARAGKDGTAAALRLASRARQIIDETGYRRRIPDHALILARMCALDGDARQAAQHLAEVKTWIGNGWGCHKAEHASISQLLSTRPVVAVHAEVAPPAWWRRMLGN